MHAFICSQIVQLSGWKTPVKELLDSKAQKTVYDWVEMHNVDVVYDWQVSEVRRIWLAAYVTSSLTKTTSLTFWTLLVKRKRSSTTATGTLHLVTLSSQKVNVKVKYHGDGPAMLGCHDLTVSCIQFTHDAAFARIEHLTAHTYDLQLTLKTLKSNCILTYTETSAATERGYIQVGS